MRESEDPGAEVEFIGPGDYFGEECIVSSAGVSYTASAPEPTVVISIEEVDNVICPIVTDSLA
jgi:CRP-like cAMP-binding protein